MAKDPDIKEIVKIQNRRVHLANERTFLAWVRTSIGIMAFGFVVEKFSLFVNQIDLLLKGSNLQGIQKQTSEAMKGYSAFSGIYLITLGVLICFLAYIKFKKVEKQIIEDRYSPSILLNVMLTLSIISVGIFLIIYLVYGI